MMLTFTLGYTTQVQLQEVKGAFGPPLKLELLSTGTFGEPRGEHFHAGLDMKTNGQIGYDLFAVKQGYISRIRVMATGYGKVLYINHPNGYTSVYAHMESFNPTITAFIKEQQYQKQSFEVDLYPSADKFPLDSAAYIGKSGNTGGSQGPHLHFEIRKTSTEVPMNPLLFGYPLEDNVRPLLQNIHVMNIDKGYYESKGNTYSLIKLDSVYTIYKGMIPVEEGRVAISVNGWDQHSKTTNKNGIYSMQLNVNENPVFRFNLDGVHFDDTRYVHAFTHFGIKRTTKSVYYNLYRLPGNNLNIYSNLVDDGFITLAKNDTVNILITAKDHAGNKSQIRFKLLGTAKKEETVNEPQHLYNIENKIEKEDFVMVISPNTLFENTTLKYSSVKPLSKGIFSNIHFIDNSNVPFFRRVELKIKPVNLPERLKEKAVIVFQDFNGSITTLSSKWEDGFLTANPRNTGKYYIKADTIKPSIRLLNFNTSLLSFRGNSIRVHISDAMSGVKSYNGFIDNKWVLFEYDAKSNLLFYQFDENCSKGEHILKIIVKDDVGNTHTLEQKFFY